MVLSAEDSTSIYKRQVAEGAKRIQKLGGYIDGKKYEEVRTELTRQVSHHTACTLWAIPIHPLPRTKASLEVTACADTPLPLPLCLDMAQLYDLRKSALGLAKAKGSKEAEKAAKTLFQDLEQV